jgi:outer membrane protein TolC
MILRYILIVLLVFTIHSSNAQESMISEVSYPFLEKLVATAKANYPKMKAYDHSITIAKLRVKNAKLDWLNILSFIYLYSPANANTNAAAQTSFLSGFQTGFSLSIGTILQKPGLVKTAKEELEISKLSQEEYNLNIEAVVQQRYFLYVQQLTMLNWKIKDLASTESTMKDVKYKFEKGEETFENYNKARTSYSTAVQGKIQAEGTYLLAKSTLEEIIGVKLESVK